MYNYPSYMTSWRYVIGLIIVVFLLYIIKIITYKEGKKAIEKEFYNKGIRYTISPVYGQDAIKAGRFAVIFGDLLFWFFMFLMIIFTVREFKYLF